MLNLLYSENALLVSPFSLPSSLPLERGAFVSEEDDDEEEDEELRLSLSSSIFGGSTYWYPQDIIMKRITAIPIIPAKRKNSSAYTIQKYIITSPCFNNISLLTWLNPPPDDPDSACTTIISIKLPNATTNSQIACITAFILTGACYIINNRIWRINSFLLEYCAFVNTWLKEKESPVTENMTSPTVTTKYCGSNQRMLIEFGDVTSTTWVIV